jgi:multisubunit Na+/H+ antiporter MnhB subunit
MSSLSRKTAAGLLIVAMVVAAMMLWVGIPLGWLWIGSMMVDSSQPSMGPYMVVGIGIVASVVIDALIISRLNRRYERIVGGRASARLQLPWLKSMRGERERPRDASVLDVILVATVALCGGAMLAWFLLLAGSPLPNA